MSFDRIKISRRRMLGMAAAVLANSAPARGAPRRIAVIDWGLLETAVAIGSNPVAATELIQFRKIAVEPEIPESVADLGLRGTPNFELLRQIAPDLILISGFYEYQRAALERIAPVLALPIFEPGKQPFPLARNSALALGREVGRADEAQRYVDATIDELEAAKATLRPVAGRPVFVVNLGDSRHFRAFGADSMFGNVLGQVGLNNAWTDATSYSAAAPVGLEALAKVPEAAIAVISPLPPEVLRALPRNALWNALPAVRENRVAILDPINHFGGLPSARRFARLLTAGLVKGEANG